PPIPVTLAIVASCCFGPAAWSGVGPGPDGKLVAAGLGEMESAAAREREYRLDDLPARRHHLRERAFEIVAVEDNERASPVDARRGFGPEETTVQALARESRVIGPVILERPSERLFEKALGSGDIPRGALDVIDLLVCRQGCPLNWRSCFRIVPLPSLALRQRQMDPGFRTNRARRLLLRESHQVSVPNTARLVMK